MICLDLSRCMPSRNTVPTCQTHLKHFDHRVTMRVAATATPSAHQSLHDHDHGDAFSFYMLPLLLLLPLPVYLPLLLQTLPVTANRLYEYWY